jgi:PAS domain-containing protein
MDQTEQLLELVGDIYDAALDSSLWSEVVSKAARFVGGSAAAIFSKSPIDGNGDVHYESGTDPHYRQLYFEKYVKLDPATAGHYFADIGDPIAVENIMPYREFMETRFYKEWARPQGIVDFVSAVLDKSVTSAALFCVFRYVRDGIVDDEARRRMRLIVPHIRRAVLVGRVIELRSAEAATFADTLDGLSAGMCLVDAAGQIVHTNAACQAIFAGADFLSAVDGRVVARDETIDQTLRQLFAAASGGDAAIETQGIALPLRAQDGTRRPSVAADVRRPASCRNRIRRDRGLVYSQGGNRSPICPGNHRPHLQSDAHRVTCAARHRRGRRRSRGRGSPRCGGNHRQNPPRPPVREDRRRSPGRSR